MKQVKQGKKGKKSFLKSKKSLVAAALAALIALAGVTYAWFTWSVGVTGGTLKADYVQIDAEFGVYVKLYTMLDNYARYFENNSGDPVVKGEPAGYYYDDSIDISNLIDADYEIFVPFRYFQGPDESGLIDYLDDVDYNGTFSVLDVLSSIGAEVYVGVNDIFLDAWFMVADTGSYYSYWPAADVFGGANDGGVAAAKVFNRYVQHELPSNELEVGYAIKNLGAACYINIPNIKNSVMISQATPDGANLAGYYNNSNLAGVFVQPAWGVAQYGNFVNNSGGWSVGVTDPKVVGTQDSLQDWLDAKYGASAPSATGKLSLDDINAAYYDAAEIIYDGTDDVYPWGVTKAGNAWVLDINSNSNDWRIDVNIKPVDEAIAVAQAIQAIYGTPPPDLLTVNATVYSYLTDGQLADAYNTIHGAFAFDTLVTNAMSSLYGVGSFTISDEYDAAAYCLALDAIGELGDYAVSDLAVPAYDLDLLVDDVSGITVLRVQGQAFTYQTLATAPTINIKSTIHYGKYLDNRFVGSELYFEDAGVVAVQYTSAAAVDVFSVDDGTGTGNKVPDAIFYEGNTRQQIIAASDIDKLPAAYINAITP